MDDNVLVDEVIKYLKSYNDKLTEADQTAQWSIEEDSHQPFSCDSLETSGGPVTDTVFSTNGSHIPAQIIALGEAYDAMQAADRLSKVFKTSRKDYYAQSGNDHALRGKRLSLRTTMLASTVNTAEPLRKAQHNPR